MNLFSLTVDDKSEALNFIKAKGVEQNNAAFERIKELVKTMSEAQIAELIPMVEELKREPEREQQETQNNPIENLQDK